MLTIDSTKQRKGQYVSKSKKNQTRSVERRLYNVFLNVIIMFLFLAVIALGSGLYWMHMSMTEMKKDFDHQLSVNKLMDMPQLKVVDEKIDDHYNNYLVQLKESELRLSEFKNNFNKKHEELNLKLEEDVRLALETLKSEREHKLSVEVIARINHLQKINNKHGELIKLLKSRPVNSRSSVVSSNKTQDLKERVIQMQMWNDKRFDEIERQINQLKFILKSQ
jgi:hypothetical protein